MREIKIRYVLRKVGSEEIYYKWYYLNQIESGLQKLFDINFTELIARDQLTGLKDKNGVDIYGGDILKVSQTTYLVIFADDACFSVAENIGFGVSAYLFQVNQASKIIGNIHQHPELLEK